MTSGGDREPACTLAGMATILPWVLVVAAALVAVVCLVALVRLLLDLVADVRNPNEH